MDIKSIIPLIKAEFLKHNFVMQQCKWVYKESSDETISRLIEDHFGESGTFKTVSSIDVKDAITFLQKEVSGTNKAILEIKDEDLDDIEDAFFDENLLLIIPENHPHKEKFFYDKTMIFMLDPKKSKGKRR